MKKNISYIICFTSCSCWYTGCKKWLDLKPQDGIIKEEFWKTKEQVKACCIWYLFFHDGKCYGYLWKDKLHPFISRSSFLYGAKAGQIILQQPTFTSNDDIDLMNVNIQPINVNANWRPFYKTINFCNTVIAKST